MLFDPDTCELLGTRPNPLEPGEATLLQRTRPSALSLGPRSNLSASTAGRPPLG